MLSFFRNESHEYYKPYALKLLYHTKIHFSLVKNMFYLKKGAKEYIIDKLYKQIIL